MNSILDKALLILFIFNSKTLEAANKFELGMGATNNATYIESNKKSDLYYYLKSYNSNEIFSQLIDFYFQYRQFNQQEQNNSILWNIKLTISSVALLKSELDFFIGLGGQKFTSMNPESSDEGYDSTFFETSIAKNIIINEISQIMIESGIQILNYKDINNRNDQKYFANMSFDLQLNRKNILSPFIELGLIGSSNSLYQKNYFELGTDWYFHINESLKLKVGFFKRNVVYPSRVISRIDQVPSTKRNQKSNLVYQNEIETQSLNQIDITLTKTFIKTYLLVTIIKARQVTRSQTEDYNEDKIQGAIGFNY